MIFLKSRRLMGYNSAGMENPEMIAAGGLHGLV